MGALAGGPFHRFLAYAAILRAVTAYRSTVRVETLGLQEGGADAHVGGQDALAGSQGYRGGAEGHVRIGNGMDDSDGDEGGLEDEDEDEREYIALGEHNFSLAEVGGDPFLAMEGGVDLEATPSGDNVPIFNFNGVYYNANKKADMTITRQGTTYYEGKAKSFPFQRSSLYKEYVVKMNNAVRSDLILGKKKNVAQCSQPVYVKAEAVPGTCGIGVFTQRERRCDPLSAEAVEQEWEQLKRFTPPTGRGFGVEFELVARNPSDEQYKELVEDLKATYAEEEVQEHLNSESGGVHGVHLCFRKVVNRPDRLTAKKTCARNSACAIAEFCMDCKACLGKSDDASCGMCEEGDDAVCAPAIECDQGEAPPKEGGACPVPISKWNWEVDKSVLPLSGEEAAEVDGDDETNGTAVELTAPGPPHVLGGEPGWHSVVQMLSSMRHMGVQAGPSSGIHVHVNVLSDKAPGTRLTFSQIATVWAAYAKYQLVIDEMFTPNRVPNHFANSLFLGDCKTKMDRGKCSSDPCGCNKRIFKQMHGYLQAKGDKGSKRAFCNKVVAMEGSTKACTWRHPHQRYSQLNLIPMHRFGTIEFRAHSATYDAERTGRWVQFLIAFVEYFGAGPGHAEMKDCFEAKWEDDYDRLAHLQREVSTADLYGDLKRAMPPGQEHAMEDTMQYFLRRTWEIGDRACHPPPDQRAVTFAGKCTSDNTDFTPAFLEKEQGDGQEMLMVQLPPLEYRYPVHTVDVMMPSGQPWKVKLHVEDTVPTVAELPTRKTVPITKTGGTYEFRFVVGEADRRRELEAEIAETHRCCCGVHGQCKWFSEDLQVDGHCPYIFRPPDTEDFCVYPKLKKPTMMSFHANRVYMQRRLRCKYLGDDCMKTWHPKPHRRPGLQCLVTSEPHAYWTGSKCAATVSM